MPKTITKIVYTFAELLERETKGITGASKAADRAREWMREGATDFQRWEVVYEQWTEALESIGFSNVDISFSGFWSQGDGASFTASVDAKVLLDWLKTPTIPNSEDGKDWSIQGWLVKQVDKPNWNRQYSRLPLDRYDASVVRSSSHYLYERTCTFELEGSSNHKRIDAIANTFQEEMESFRLDVCKAIYKSLQEEFEYRTDDVQLAEDADANEWTFDAFGRREG